MKVKITANNVKELSPRPKPYDVRDTDIKGFLLRVQPSGGMTYYLDYRLDGKRNRIRLGSHGTITPTQARDKAKVEAGKVANDINVQGEKKRRRQDGVQAKFSTLKGFLDQKYGPWVKAHRKDGTATLTRIETQFKHLLNNKLDDITAWVIDKWRTERKKAGTAPSTINRDLTTLKAALSMAVEWDLLPQHPLSKTKPLKIDSNPKVRYLSAEEEQRLNDALIKREHKLRAERDSANKWRKSRGYTLLAPIPIGDFADYLKPMVLLSLNTGMRRGEVFDLTWENVDLKNKQLTVIGPTTKAGKTRYLPLNNEALKMLQIWRHQNEGQSGYVFPSKDGHRFDNVTSSWNNLRVTAKIPDFRWHDMRHDFASKLVMAGVDLNTVRELLGHSDLKMTLRYAHLAPEHKAAAVAKLVKTSAGTEEKAV